ncbi:MAG: sortase [Bacilli bacterium]|nr:sortase [Bacilli bacterium]
MRIEKEKNKKRFKKSQLIIVGSLLILLGGCVICGKYAYNYFLDRIEDIKIEEFYNEQENIDTEVIEETTEKVEETKQETKIDYVAVIKIPKIGLEKGLCKKGSYCNNVNQNIQILKESSYPDVSNGNFILAGHSGNGRTAYFRNVYKLDKDDEISIIYGGFEYKYKIVNIYDVEKTGTASIVRNREKTTLTLVTCRHNTNKQIIVISELVERKEYNG